MEYTIGWAIKKRALKKALTEEQCSTPIFNSAIHVSFSKLEVHESDESTICHAS